MGHVHDQKERVVQAGDFKQRCLALLDQVSDTGVTIVVTKRKRPVARIVPIAKPSVPLEGSLRILADREQDLFSTGEAWAAEKLG